MDLQLTTYPAESSAVSIAQVALGGRMREGITMIIDFVAAANGDPDDIDVNITLSNGPDNSDAPECASQLLEVVSMLINHPEFRAEWDRQFGELKEQHDQSNSD